ncbi:MAG: hypothetical protein ACPL0A_01480 [Candidatus Micrarchaeia archaeon]
MMKEAVYIAGILFFLIVAIILIYQVTTVPMSTLPATVAIISGVYVPSPLLFISIFSLVTILLLSIVRMLR